MNADTSSPFRTVPLDSIVADEKLWPRRDLDQDRVASFLGLIRDEGAAALPPLDVVADGERFLLADGWHRLNALRALRYDEIAVRLLDHVGLTPTDATYRHGLLTAATAAKPLTRQERVIAVDRLLLTSTELPDREIARLTGVSPTTVGAHRRRLAGTLDEPASDGESIERAYLSAIGADELARTLARALDRVFEQRGLSDYFLGDRTGKRLARALLDLHSPDAARAWAERLLAWANTAVAELRG